MHKFSVCDVVACFFCLVSAANGAIIQGPVVDAITYSTARVTWITDVSSTTVIRYGPTSAYGKTTTGFVSGTIHSWYISGLAPSTTYHFQACSAAGSGTETCSADRTFTTTAQSSQSLPEPPRATVDVSMPMGAWGTPFQIAPDCSNLPAVITSLADLTGNLNYEVRIPARTECRGQFIFPKRPNHTGWVVVRSNSWLPEGTRVSGSSVGQMAVFRTDALPAPRYHLNFLPATCSPDALFSAFNVPGMGVFVCKPQGGPGTPKGISAVAAATGGALVTVPAHGYSTGNVVKVAMTNAGVDGTWRIKVINANQVLLEGAPTPRTYTAGGTVTRNESWMQVPHQSGTTLPTSCTVNSWFYKSDKAPAEAVYWCTQPNVWTNTRLIFTPSGESYAAIQFADGAMQYRFIGLEVTHNPVPNPPPAGWSVKDYKQGSVGSLITTKESNSRIVFDRCDVHGLDYPARLGIGVQLDGSHVALINSRVHKVNRWQSTNDGINDEAFGINIGPGPGPGKIENNYIEAIGITIFFPGAGMEGYHGTPAADYEIRRNYFAHSDKYLYGSPANVSGKNYSNRHHLEWKSGRRMLVEGNIFDTNWADINQGAFVMLSPRLGSLPPPKTITSLSHGIVTVSSDTYPYKPGMLISLRSTGAANHDGIWQVASVPTPTSFRLANAPAGTGTTGSSSAVASDIQVSDIDLRNNIFRYGPNVLWVLGHEYYALNTKTTQRIAFRNNMVHNIDARAGINGGWSSPISSYVGTLGRPGIVVYAARGVEDLTVMNNTMHDVKGTAPTFLFFDAIDDGGNAGLLVQNNIFTASKPNVAQINGTYFGTNALNAGWTAYSGMSWVMTGNVFCCSTPSPSSLVPPLNSLLITEGAIGFNNAAAGDYSLALSSPYTAGKACFGISGDCTSDGKNPGVDFNQLRAVLTPDERH
jgi:hypothetical protein